MNVSTFSQFFTCHSEIETSLKGMFEAPIVGLSLPCDGSRNAAEDSAGQVDWAELPIGGRAAGSVHDVKDYGVVCDLEAHADVVALATPDQVIPGEKTFHCP